MDGTYGNPYAFGQSSLSPQTPQGGAYRANVNRQKTRKWVEAKAQNYDGDDWGADEFEEEEEQPAPKPVSRVTTGLRPIGQRVPSDFQRPSERLDLAPSVTSRNVSGPPSLHIQTQPLASTPAPSSGPAPAPARQTSTTPQAPGNNDHIFSPKLDNAPINSPPPNIDIQSLPRKSIIEQPTDDMGSNLSLRKERKGDQSPLDKPLPHLKTPNQDSHGAQGQVEAASNNIERITSPPEDLVLSPQLPDVARLSLFGPDIFTPTPSGVADSSSAPSGDTSSPKPLGVLNEGQDRGSESGANPAVLGDNADHDLMVSKANQLSVGGSNNNSGQVSPISAPGDRTLETPSGQAGTAPATESHKPALLPESDPRSVPHLRTPSPHVPTSTLPVSYASIQNPQQSEAAPASATSGAPSAPEFTPTEPLHPKAADHSPLDYEPRPFQREFTMSTTTSSPVKESDVLSEEILRSLSPIGKDSNPMSPADKRKSSFFPATPSSGQEGSYSLSDYDMYWADSNEVTSPGDLTSPIKDAPRLSTQPLETSTSSADPTKNGDITAETTLSELRRRFSWEAENRGNSTPAKNESPVDTSTTAPSAAAVPIDETSSQGVFSQSSGPDDETTSMLDARKPSIVFPDSAGISHQVSKASSSQLAVNERGLESPSSVSVLSDTNTPQAQDSHRLSFADEKALVSASPTPPPEEHPAISTPVGPAPAQELKTVSEAQIMPFKDIMGLPTTAERTAKYEESRVAVASSESGLGNWISHLQAQHPEYAQATPYVRGGVPATAPGSGPPGSAGSQPAVQQPYYQQYLNASTPTNSSPSPGRSRIVGLPISTHAATSAFGNSSNQIGTKSKEFMHSAGKMGKGLLSKGRSKLRGTGDKGESIPSPVQSKQKIDRRTSWGLSLGPRSRTNRPAEHSNQEMSDNVAIESPQSSLARDQENHVPHLPSPVDSESGTWNPFANMPLIQDDGGVKLETKGTARDEPIPPHSTSEGRSSDDWILVSSQRSSGQIQPVSLKTSSTIEPSNEARPTAAITGGSVGAHPDLPQAAQPTQTESETAQSNSLFSLPLIRRSSTFDLSPSNDKLKKDDAPQLSQPDKSSNIALTEDEVSADAQNLAKVGPIYHQVTTGDIDGSSSQQGDFQPEIRAHPNQNLLTDTAHTQSVTRPQQPLPPSAPVSGPSRQLGQAHSSSRADAGNPVQLLPSGPWKLEESHLVEPLQAVSKKRNDGSSQHQPRYDYDKETGMPLSGGSSSAGHRAQQRREGSDVPPSSAKRYPGLFRPAGQSDHQQQQQPRNSSQTSTISHAQFMRDSMDSTSSHFDLKENLGNGSATPSHDQSRTSKGSGFLKDLGNRIMKSGSTEHPSATPDPTQVLSSDKDEETNIKDDGVSESSVVAEGLQERRKRKSSFLLNLRGRSSMDFLSQAGRDHGEQQEHAAMPTAGTTASAVAPQKPKSARRSLDIGRHFNLKPGDPPQGTTTGSNNENTDARDGIVLPKKRLTGFGGMFQRSAPDNSPKPGASGSALPPMRSPPGQETHEAASSNPAGGNGNIESPIPGTPRSIGASIGAASQLSQNPPTGGNRKRRTSAGNILAGILGHHSNAVKSEGNSDHLGIQPQGGVPLQRRKTGDSVLSSLHAVSIRSGITSNGFSPTYQNRPVETTQAVYPTDRGGSPISHLSHQSTHGSTGMGSVGRGQQSPPLDHISAMNQRIAMEFSQQGHTSSQAYAPSSVQPPTPGLSSTSPPVPSSSGYWAAPQPGYQPRPDQRMAMDSSAYQVPSHHNPGQRMMAAEQPRDSFQSFRTTGPPVPPKPNANQSIPPNATTTGVRSEGQSSKWRDIKNRLSGQLTQISQAGSGKSEGPSQVTGGRATNEKRSSTGKLLGAFKRNSKQLTPAAQPSAQDPSEMHRQQPVAGQSPLAHHQQQQLSWNTGNAPGPAAMFSGPTQFGPQPSITPSQQSVNQHGAYSQQVPPGNGQQSPQYPLQAPQQAQQAPGHYVSQQLQHQQIYSGPWPGEQQYNHVAIPEGYKPVRSEGVSVPSQINMRQRTQTMPMQPLEPQPGILPRHATMPLQGLSQGHHVSEGGQRRASGGAGQALAGEIESPTLGAGHHNYSAHPPSDAAQTSRGQTTHRPGFTDAQIMGNVANPDPRHRISDASPGSVNATVAPSPPDPQEERKGKQLLAVDVAKAQAGDDDDMYDATPRLSAHKTGESQAKSDVSQLVGEGNGQPKEKTVERSSAQLAELEDTEDARRRKIRLESQEEKIFYDPNQDSDGEYAPKMVAASYPGQEWNPYGEPEFWNDRDDRDD